VKKLPAKQDVIRLGWQLLIFLLFPVLFIVFVDVLFPAGITHSALSASAPAAHPEFSVGSIDYGVNVHFC